MAFDIDLELGKDLLKYAEWKCKKSAFLNLFLPLFS
jgi:hypothetical protein